MNTMGLHVDYARCRQNFRMYDAMVTCFELFKMKRRTGQETDGAWSLYNATFLMWRELAK